MAPVRVETDRVILDKVALLDRIGGDPEFLGEITEIYLDGRRQLLGDIRAALGGGDAPGAARAAHTLKGCVGNMGADAAFEAAYEVEKLARQGEVAAAARACAELESEIALFEQALENLRRELAAN